MFNEINEVKEIREPKQPPKLLGVAKKMIKDKSLPIGASYADHQKTIDTLDAPLF